MGIDYAKSHWLTTSRYPVLTMKMSAPHSKRPPQELKAEKHSNTILHGEESLIVNVHIFNVSMTLRRAGETLR